MKYILTIQADEEKNYAKLDIFEIDGDNTIHTQDVGNGGINTEMFIKDFKEQILKLKEDVQKEKNNNEM